MAKGKSRLCPRCRQRLDPRFRVCSCVEPNADPVAAERRVGSERPPGPGPVGGLPVSKMTNQQVCAYVAYTLEGWAHLQGGLGALTPAVLLALAQRLRGVGAHGPRGEGGAMSLYVEHADGTTGEPREVFTLDAASAAVADGSLDGDRTGVGDRVCLQDNNGVTLVWDERKQGWAM